MFKNLFKKKKSFDVVDHQGQFILRNQCEELNNCSKEDILKFIDIMINDFNEFIVLTPPSAIHKVQFIQGALVNDGIDIQLSIQKGNRCYLYHKVCNKQECIDTFIDFYNGVIPCLDDYKLLEF